MPTRSETEYPSGTSRESAYSNYDYDRQSREKILTLLSEYSTKMRDMSDVLEKLRTREWLFLLLSGSFIVLGLVPVAYGEKGSRLLGLTGVGQGVILVLGFLISCFAFYLYYSATRKRALLRKEMQIAALKLERVIQVASQMSEHQDSDMGTRLETDLRLVEAEGALRYARL